MTNARQAGCRRRRSGRSCDATRTYGPPCRRVTGRGLKYTAEAGSDATFCRLVRGPRRTRRGRPGDRTVDYPSRVRIRPRPAHAEVPPVVHRRGPRRRRHRRGDPGLRVAAQGRRQLQGPVPVPHREVAVVHGQPRQGLLPLLRLPGGRRRLQVRRAAGEARLPGHGPAGRAEVRHPDARARGRRGAGRERGRTRGAAAGFTRWRRRGSPSSSPPPAGAARPRLPAAGTPADPGHRRGAQARVGAAGARRPAPAAAAAGIRRRDDPPERPGQRPRRRRGRRPLPQPADGADRPRRRVDRRLRRPRARARSGAQVPQLARDADLHEEPDALRPQPHQRRAARRRALRSSSRATSTSRSCTRPAACRWWPAAAPR